MHVARLEASDALRYRELMLEAYETVPDAFTSTAAERAAEPEAFWLRRIADPAGRGAAFGAFDAGELVGAAALELSGKTRTRHKALVVGMYVEPAARGRGAGRALLRAIIDHALDRDELRVLTLTVTDGNEAAVELYRSVGFTAFGVEPLAILTPTGFKAKVHMSLVLERR